MREWLSGGAPPCQGGGRGFDPRLALSIKKGHPIGCPFFIETTRRVAEKLRSRSMFARSVNSRHTCLQVCCSTPRRISLFLLDCEMLVLTRLRASLGKSTNLIETLLAKSLVRLPVGCPFFIETTRRVAEKLRSRSMFARSGADIKTHTNNSTNLHRQEKEKEYTHLRFLPHPDTWEGLL